MAEMGVVQAGAGRVAPSGGYAPGLDVVRSLAIGAVLLCHVSIIHAALFGPNPLLITLSVLLGYYGVELFFVLSGFLIGEILLRDVLPRPGLGSVGRFWFRRALRILPAYYAVLLVLIGMEVWRGGGEPRWAYVFFVQNYDHGAERFFPVSWSLTIEQWSYLLAPLVMIALPRLFGRRAGPWPLWLSLVAVVGVFLVLRLGTALEPGLAWDVGVRKQIHLRLDAVFFGVLVVSVRHFRPALYGRLASLGFWVLVMLGLSLLVIAQGVLMITEGSPGGPDSSLFFKTFGFTLVDLLLALTLPFFAVHCTFEGGWLRSRLSGLFSAGSRYAYSLYLVHFGVFVAVHDQLKAWPVEGFAWSIVAFVLGVLVALVLSFALAFCLHRFVELPGMNLRGRFAAKM